MAVEFNLDKIQGRGKKSTLGGKRLDGGLRNGGANKYPNRRSERGQIKSWSAKGVRSLEGAESVDAIPGGDCGEGGIS